jgi:hypothetical protein
LINLEETSLWKRRSFLKKAGAGLAVGAVAMPAIAQNAPTIKWRLASSFPKSLDTIYGAAEIGRQARGRSHRRQVPDQVFAGGEIVPPFGVLDAVKDGTVEMGTPLRTTSSARIPRLPSTADPVRHDQPPGRCLVSFTATARS